MKKRDQLVKDVVDWARQYTNGGGAWEALCLGTAVYRLDKMAKSAPKPTGTQSMYMLRNHQGSLGSTLPEIFANIRKFTRGNKAFTIRVQVVR